MDDNLAKMENFFSKNLNIKELLYKIVPNREDGFNHDTITNYVDKFLKTLDEIKSNLFSILESAGYGEDLKNKIERYFSRYETQILGRISGYEDLKTIYQNCCSNMNSDLINQVKTEFVGYYVYGGNVFKIIEQCQTINEILHVVHASIVNNESYYKSMPVISKKVNYEGYSIILYGRENELSNNLFVNFPTEMSCGDADIISLENHILMMIRDRGHALAIQIEIDVNNVILVKYFIPKICNVDMVNVLKGVNRVDMNSRFTTGSFISNKENLSVDIIEFIKGVPMDKDMVWDLSNSQIEPEQLQDLNNSLINSDEQFSERKR